MMWEGLRREIFVCGEVHGWFLMYEKQGAQQKKENTSDCAPDEVIHVGDSWQSELSARINPVLIDRNGDNEHLEVTTVKICLKCCLCWM